jgi:hypothetical protein
MARMTLIILLLSVLVVILMIWGIWEAVRGREAPSSNRPRKIVRTWGAGYPPFLRWKEDWNWEP